MGRRIIGIYPYCIIVMNNRLIDFTVELKGRAEIVFRYAVIFVTAIARSKRAMEFFQ